MAVFATLGVIALATSSPTATATTATASTTFAFARAAFAAPLAFGMFGAPGLTVRSVPVAAGRTMSRFRGPTPAVAGCGTGSAVATTSMCPWTRGSGTVARMFALVGGTPVFGLAALRGGGGAGRLGGVSVAACVA